MARKPKRPELKPRLLCEVKVMAPDFSGDTPCRRRLGNMAERTGDKGTWAPYTDPDGWQWHRCPVHGAVAIRRGVRRVALIDLLV